MRRAIEIKSLLSVKFTFNDVLTASGAQCGPTQELENSNIVKLREREGQRVDLGRSLKGHLQIVDCRLSYTFPDALH